MTAISGRTLSVSSTGSVLLDACLKMLLATSAWASTRCWLTWQHGATPQGRSLFRLVPSKPRTDATGSGFWPTVRASEWKGCGDWRTQTARTWTRQHYLTGVVLTTERIDGARLNPDWVQRMMGYPDGWLDVD